jgi:eukaryotic-like serine/threonine-protein kinase
MTRPETSGPYRITTTLPPHLAEWQLPPEWRWGTEGLAFEYRHYQEIIDALGRSLSLVSAPDPAHAAWLAAEAKRLAHRNHPAIPTTYHYWASYAESKRGPGYLRRWIAGETVGARLRRLGAGDLPFVLQVLRAAGSALSYLHDSAATHGAISPDSVWVTPTGRLWLLGWHWALGRDEVPPTARPDRGWMPTPPEWGAEGWSPTPASDQWQLAAICFVALTGEPPPTLDIPPIRWLRPESPRDLATVLDRALLPRPEQRFESVGAMLRALERGVAVRPFALDGEQAGGPPTDSAEARLRWAVRDDYDVIKFLGEGTYGTVWRVRDLALEREVALKMLHPAVARDDLAVSRFRREALLAAQLAHPAIVPIFDWDSRGDVAWYTMELAEGGSVADLIARSGPRLLGEIAEQIDLVLDGLKAAHAVGIVHRDLKPENILIDRYRRWRITDLGIANVTGEDRPGASGTPAFAAPEQLLGEAQGPAVDCYAMAAIVAFALLGRPPYAGDVPSILAQQIAERFSGEGLPDALIAWIRRGLAPDVERRFPDAAAMQEAWRVAVQGVLRLEGGASWWKRLVTRPGRAPEAEFTT